ncbi:hypothetical protein G1K75_01530 [Tenacibaculum finnmarkense]|uniref:hypothetical protein n=1 Tax=Tenacibaculum finnmarkense TaxID=2781243 RepID=UPI001EFBBF8C|nr:hypothetical protein [Tenacibaculum finnmarkense]MCG8804336.1 hypothetical protein [Tenacibaculum finnmarkense]MCG8855924.1 hypothetical protein [Tenacibaculum finnmarkense]
MNLSIKLSVAFFLVTSFCNAQGVNYKITYKETIGENVVYGTKEGVIHDSIIVPKSTQNGFLIGILIIQIFCLFLLKKINYLMVPLL